MDITLKALDASCTVGQCGTLVLTQGRIQTGFGEVVSDTVTFSACGKIISFTRNGHEYRGMKRQNSDAINFKRIS